MPSSTEQSDAQTALDLVARMIAEREGLSGAQAIIEHLIRSRVLAAVSAIDAPEFRIVIGLELKLTSEQLTQRPETEFVQQCINALQTQIASYRAKQRSC